MPTVILRHHSGHHDHDLGHAWTWLIALPFAFVAAMAAGEGLISAMGYDFAGEEPVPLGPAALVGIPMTLLVVIPAYMAFRLGLRVYREGDQRGLWPVVIGATIGALFLLTNLLGLFVGR